MKYRSFNFNGLIEKLGIQPAPWKYDITHGFGQFAGIHDAEGNSVAGGERCEGWLNNTKTTKAMTSAPEMLEKLIKIASIMEYYNWTVSFMAVTHSKTHKAELVIDPDEIIPTIEKATGMYWPDIKRLISTLPKESSNT